MKVLTTAKPEHFFYCVDGSVLRSINELEKKLRTLSKEAYRHHVNESKNDFHSWIKDVFQEHEMAREILTAKTQAEAAAIVRKHLSKAMQATAEIENAINSVLNANVITKAAAKSKSRKARLGKAAGKAARTPARAITQKKLPLKRKSKATSKTAAKAKTNAAKIVRIVAKIKKSRVKKAPKRRSANAARKKRKVNKKQNAGKGVSKKSGAKTAKRGISFFTKGLKGLTKKSRNYPEHKNAKTKVNKWLNWLRLVPEQ